MICWYLLVCSKIFSLFDPYTWVPKFVNLNRLWARMHNASRPIQFRKYESNFRKPCISFSSKNMTTIAERTSRTNNFWIMCFWFWVGKISVTDQWLLMTGRLWFRTLTLKGNIHFQICWRVFRSFHHVKTTGVVAACKNSVSIFCMKDTAPIQGDLY